MPASTGKGWRWRHHCAGPLCESHRSESNAMLVTGAVMVGAIGRNRPPATLALATTPIARLFGNATYSRCHRVRPFTTMKTLLSFAEARPGGGKVGWRIARGRIRFRLPVLPASPHQSPRALTLSAISRRWRVRPRLQASTSLSAHLAGTELALLIPRRETPYHRHYRAGMGSQQPNSNAQGTRRDARETVTGGASGAPGRAPSRGSSRLRSHARKSWIEALVTNGWIPALLTGADFD